MSDFYTCPKCQQSPEACDITAKENVNNDDPDNTVITHTGECPLCNAESPAEDWKRYSGEETEEGAIPLVIHGGDNLLGAIRMSKACADMENVMAMNIRIFMSFFDDTPKEVLRKALTDFYGDEERAEKMLADVYRAVWRKKCVDEELMRAVAGQPPNELMTEEHYNEKAG